MGPNQAWAINLVKILVAFLLISFIFKTINGYDQDLVWPCLSIGNLPFLLVAILFLPLNLLLESERWRFVMSNIGKRVSVKDALFSTVVGSSLSMITPFRVGDYAGRMLLLRSEDKKSSVYATFICSIYLNVINIVTGIFACVFFFRSQEILANELRLLMIVNCVVVILALILIVKFDRILNWLLGISWIQNKLTIEIEGGLGLQKKMVLLLLSFLRYTVYVFQYVLVLYFFNVDNIFIELISCISIVYFIQSSVPLPAFLSFVARIEIALLVWNLLDLPVTIVLAASATLWVINLMMPALLGLVVMLLKWDKKTG